tara:strand:- start:357 stop:1310 length:954 start_codon:yes stop_codon:yes gene_type:complete
MKLAAFRVALLSQLVQRQARDGVGYYDLEETARFAGLKVRKDWYAKAANWLRDEGLIVLDPLPTGRKKPQVFFAFPTENAGAFLEEVQEIDQFSPLPEVSKAKLGPYPGADKGIIRDKGLTYEQFKELLLIFLIDRATDAVDELGNRIDDPANYPYSLKAVADDEGMAYEPHWINRVESELFRAGMIELESNAEDGSGKYLINNPAIELSQVLVQKYFGDQGTRHDWRTSETLSTISYVAIEGCRSHIAEALKAIVVSDFTQEEKAQIRGLLKICDDALDLPNPKISLVKTVLGWLKDVREISEYIEAIWKFIESWK